MYAPLPDLLRGQAEAAYANFLWQPDGDDTLVTALEDWAAAGPQDPFLVFEGTTWSVGRFNAAANRAARAYQDMGLSKGDVLVLVMDNRPAYLVQQYACFKLGVVVAMVNPNLRGNVLAHAVAAAEPKVLLVGDEHAAEMASIRGELAAKGCTPRFLSDPEPRGIEQGDAEIPEGFEDFRELAANHVPQNLAISHEHRLHDLAAYIYTSGTTGLPKPAVVKHHRLYRAAHVMGGLLGLSSKDCIYLTLPLYHANASLIAVPSTITHRGRLHLARRFSASRFWDDCRSSGATAAMYVGELCRYLVNRPPSAGDRDHQVTRVFGNGMRPDVWAQFIERFGVEKVLEYYASTEGNAETANMFGVQGSCGPMIPVKMALLRYDVEKDAVVRNRWGRCVRALPGEPGLLVGRIKGKNEFSGYRNKDATESKILRDVFRKGDAYFNTGDLLRRDLRNHLFFVDRLGDTFRWKGENVSTQEVAEVLHGIDCVEEANVYGVEIPGQEGRAGMAALVPNGEFDPAAVYTDVASALPDYAQPRFLRLVPQMEVTGTFKQRKVAMKDEGFGEDVADAYVRDPEGRTYRPLDANLRQKVLDGRFKV